MRPCVKVLVISVICASSCLSLMRINTRLMHL